MKKEIKKYVDKKIICFGIDIEQKQNKNKVWKKDIKFPPNWTNITIDKLHFNNCNNGLAILTGKINNIMIIDIDNNEHWYNLLKQNEQNEPDTVTVITGSGGKHLYFKYSDELEVITSKDHCFSKEYDIDIKTNGGCVIAPPTNYFNKKFNRDVSYIWKKSIFDFDPIELPAWIKNLLLDKHNNKNFDKDKDKNKNEIANQNNNEIVSNDELNIQFNNDELEQLLDILSYFRCDNYNDWINVGICLFNIDVKNLYLWRKFSKKNEKYENDICEEKWDSFKKNKNKNELKLGSLLLWCKTDNKELYDKFMNKKKMNKLILSKFPNDNLELGETMIINDKCSYTKLNNKSCLLKGELHHDLPKSMYIEMIKDLVTIKCKHAECFGKVYPCQHIQLTKQEMNVVNIAFNGNVIININNEQDDDLIEFQYYDIFEDEKLNKLIYNSLTGTHGYFAEIVYYLYENDFIYGEDDNWYSFSNHRWKNIGQKNLILRNNIQNELKKLYSQMIAYYKEKDYDNKKLKIKKNISKNFDDTIRKNNIMTELIELYTINKNKNLDFTKKLDTNNNLIGFNNGIYDLMSFEFKNGKPEDYVSMSVGYEYNDEHTQKYNELIQFLNEIQPNKEELDYMLTYLSIGLVGNQLELFTILTGSGRNGKSKLIELLNKTFGEYFGSVQSQLFTRPRPDANSPDPGLLNLIKKRIVIASEPEKNSKLNSGFIKFLTGRDSTTLRNCHSNDMIEFSAKFETLLICNDIPDCDDIDNAFSKRLRCINFPTEFVNEPKKENQKKINVNINENFDYWKLDFMLLLIDYYKKYKKLHELKPTPDIMKWTDQYKSDTDMYVQFLNECTEETKKR
jgi:P4 family phage/plasmid primase-like protien